MGKAIGIDLGTTNSVMAIKQGKDLRVLQNKENEDLTRSVVGSFKGKMIVGSLAVDHMVSAPKDTILSIKRLMGRAYTDAEIENVKKHYRYDVVAPSDGTEDDVRVLVSGKEYSPIKISSLILEKLKEDAEARLNDKVDKAVITVPAYFTEKQKDATRKAGFHAGLKVQRILNEPTAAAIAFGVDNVGSQEAKTILVFDFGGGTLDVSVLTVVGGVFAELDIEGNMWLGGDDFDHKIMDYVLEDVKKEYGVDGRSNLRFMVELKKAAEKAKKVLSSVSRTDIIVTGILQDKEKNLIDVEVELGREQFERMIEGDVKASLHLVQKALQNAQLTEDQINHVLLVGGSSTIPMVQRLLKEMFGEEKILKSIDPMKCVAYGAGVLASILGDQVECPKCKHLNPGDTSSCIKCNEPLGGIVLGGVTPTDYGIQTVGDEFAVIIPKGSSYPTPEPIVKQFWTPQANMRRIKVPVYAGLNPVASKNELQAIVWLEIPENVPQGERVDVQFTLDDDSILTAVKVGLKDGSGREVEVYLDRGDEKRSRVERKLEEIKAEMDEKGKEADSQTLGGMESIYNDAVRALNSNNIEMAEKKAGEMQKRLLEIGGKDQPDWRKKAEGLISYSDFVLEQYGWLIEPQHAYRVKKLTEELTNTLSKNNQEAVEKKTAELEKEVDAVPGIVQDLLAIIRAIIYANGKGDIIRANKLKDELHEIEDAIKKGDVNMVRRKFDDLVPILQEVFKATEVVGETVGELLSSVRKHTTSDRFQA